MITRSASIALAFAIVLAARLSIETNQHRIVHQHIQQASIVQQRRFDSARFVADPESLGRLAVAVQPDRMDGTLPPQLQKDDTVAVDWADDDLAIEGPFALAILPQF